MVLIITVLRCVLLAFLLVGAVVPVTSGLSTPSSSSTTIPMRSFLVTGANKGQGLALCHRILTEHDDTHVFLCSRDLERGEQAAQEYLVEFCRTQRVTVLQLDVTDEASVQAAAQQVQEMLLETKTHTDDHGVTPRRQLCGLVSNAGILWGYPLSELLEVCATGVRRVLDAFLPLMDSSSNIGGGGGGRVVVVSSGLGPLMHQYSSPEHQSILKTAKSWDDIAILMDKCLDFSNNNNNKKKRTPDEDWATIGFSGGAFEESAPDFHMYGLAKMFADAYMGKLARDYPGLTINSCDPGLVYTDLIGSMPRYEGKAIEETTAKTPTEGVEAAMRLLFGTDVKGSGKLYAMNKEGKLLGSGIDQRPDV